MTRPVSTASTDRLPMISEDEVQDLSRHHGMPERRAYKVLADEYIRSYRWRSDSDRRAEVVFAIQDPDGHVWLHAKQHYPSHIFRLPSGGVNWEEPIVDALFREVAEETNLVVDIEHFVGIVEYTFIHGNSVAQFASYIFHLRSEKVQPRADTTEKISAFRAVLPFQLAQTAADLRNLMGDRRGWGQWRALAHDLVYEHLTR